MEKKFLTNMNFLERAFAWKLEMEKTFSSGYWLSHNNLIDLLHIDPNSVNLDIRLPHFILLDDSWNFSELQKIISS